jgi:DNA-binding beta-propeller fold protein YncE
MLIRVFISALFAALLGLAALELKVLWPLVGASTHEFELLQLGQVDLRVHGKQVHLDGLAVSPSGTIWVADTGEPGPRIVALDHDGQLIDTFRGAVGAGISADGEAVLTVDPQAAIVSRIALGGGATRTWSLDGFHLTAPRGVVRVQADTLAVAATGTGTVFLFGEDGHAVGILGASPTGVPQLLEPRYPLVDSAGRVYVNDRNGRVVRWDGQQLDAVFRTRDREAAVLTDPEQSAVDAQGRLWVADTEAGRVWVFDSSAEFLGQWQPTAAPHPIALAIDGDHIYITDRDHALLYWFQLDR